MILIDTPQRYQKPGLMRGRPFTSSHLFSDIAGPEGEKELREFAARIGLKPSWIQNPGHPVYVHFDVMNSCYDKAVKAGARPVSLKDGARVNITKKNKLRPAVMKTASRIGELSEVSRA